MTIEEKIKNLLVGALSKSQSINEKEVNEIGLELSRNSNNEHGDFSSNIALKLAGRVKRSPLKVAEEISGSIETSEELDRVEFVRPGFINFYLSAEKKHGVLRVIANQGRGFGSLCVKQRKKILLEFISANPTGPLHVGHGRHAAYGDSLARLLKKAGHEVFTEYYLNDAGRQIDILCASVLFEVLITEGAALKKVDGLYKGSYIKDIAEKLRDQGLEINEKLSLPKLSGTTDELVDALILEMKTVVGPDLFAAISDKAVLQMTELLQSDLADFGVAQDNFYSEKSLFSEGRIEDACGAIKKTGNAYEKDGALWLESTKHGDDKDRVVIREDGRSTYFASDIAYHQHKKLRGFDLLINVLGSDHHGYVSRLEAGLASTGNNPSDLEVILMQFVTLYRGKKKLQMSTRSGNFVPMRDLYSEVGVDAARFFYVSRSHDQHLDFDLELATKQNNNNPVYYIQYANARIKSVFKEIKKRGYVFDEGSEKLNLGKLGLPIEEDIVSFLGKYPETILKSADSRSVNKIANYLKSLAQLFHSYYGSTKFVSDDEETRNARLLLLLCVSTIIEDGLEILGVSSPVKM
ncbi:MAG: arginine--tRNA ligase [Gammaproteobacteria bacterium]|nr:arginine--tRNA ligase [Gammaproteobacteria bacterium]MBQ08441.1 arginine--tRNA ligase [Gammaproteobacteria bacterium]HJM08472.1 arginine--tRNA ligase [Gammaproteobacteria bacterium]|tara:strand:+ start:16399 stop:18135 length:1737 start_codon:yes stop_codon:yes gene_type:complete